jgi:splicing factor 3A subunit 3
MSGILETQRSGIEELERIEQAISDRISWNPHLLPDTEPLTTDSGLNGKRKRPLRDTALQRLEIERFLQRYQDQCKYLKASFEPARTLKEAEPGHPALLRQTEVKSLGQSNASKATFDLFYKQLATVKDFHRRYPNQPVEDLRKGYLMKHVLMRENAKSGSVQGDEQLSRDDQLLSSFTSDLNVDSLFSGEEFYGKFLDLVGFHERFLNFKFISRHISYGQYLDLFYAFNEKALYSNARLRNMEYFEYIAELHRYLESYYRKVYPLDGSGLTILRIEQDFDSAWSKREIEWFKNNGDMEANENAKVNEENDHLASGNQNNEGLYCKACSKQFTNEAVFNGHLSGKKHTKNAELLEASSDVSSSSDLKLRALALHEYCIRSLAQLITKTISATKQNIERRQALTDRERRIESQNLQAEIFGEGNLSDGGEEDEEEETEDEVIYNPLKLPLGWDGKPIPFWLYKIQGLGIEYPCEICGNFVYNGRRAFEKHFKEPRHIHGLKCLAIEYSNLFKDITSIKDALELQEKVNSEEGKRQSKDAAIEMEDDEGNVMSEKVYNDLKKQGLL